jgi:MinD-like ATPase involved in chromosome partitioning or flagellar assembly
MDVLLAAPGVRGEDELVAAAPASGVRILRRCVDAVDILAAVATFPHALPVVSASLPRTVAATIDRLGAQTVGIADDDDDETRLRALGVTRIVRSDTERMWSALVMDVDEAVETVPSTEGSAGLVPEPSPARPRGRLVAVWGPPGAPGRTTVAVGLADALARGGWDTCLIDADTYAPSIAMALGVQAPGIAAACRRTETDGGADVRGMSVCVRPRLSVLPGLVTSDEWSQLRTPSLEALWASTRQTFDISIVDVGACIEDDEAGAPWGRRRNAAAVTALQEADEIVVVGRGSPEGAARLAMSWSALPGSASRWVVQNRTSRGAGDWSQALRALGIDVPVVELPDDPRSVDRCWRYGATLSEKSARSGLARALRSLASTLMGD